MNTWNPCRHAAVMSLSLLSLTACRSGDAVVSAQTPTQQTRPAAAQPQTLPPDAVTPDAVTPGSVIPATATVLPAAPSACGARYPQLSFGVFANTREQDLFAVAGGFDRSRPLAHAAVQVNGLELRTDSQGQVSLPLPAADEVTIRVEAPGYDRYETHFTAFNHGFSASSANHCRGYVAALSPLSDEELKASEIEAETDWISSVAPGMHFNEATGFSYGVVRTADELARLESRVKPFLELSPTDPNFFREFIAKGLAEGKQAVLISNGSLGKGDVHNLIERVSRLGDKAILASHLNLLFDESVRHIADIDRGYVKTEIVLIPADIDTLVFDALLPGPGGHKKRLEVSTEAARLK